MWVVCLPSDILPENEVLFSLCSKHLFRGLEQGLALISQRDCFFKPGLHTFYTFDCFSNFCCQKTDITRLIYPYNKVHLPLFTSKKKKKKKIRKCADSCYSHDECLQNFYAIATRLFIQSKNLWRGYLIKAKKYRVLREICRAWSVNRNFVVSPKNKNFNGMKVLIREFHKKLHKKIRKKAKTIHKSRFAIAKSKPAKGISWVKLSSCCLLEHCINSCKWENI